MSKNKDEALDDIVTNYIGYAIQRANYYDVSKDQNIASHIPKNKHVDPKKFNLYDAFIAVTKRAIEIADDYKDAQNLLKQCDQSSDQDIKDLKDMGKTTAMYASRCKHLSKELSICIKEDQHYLDVIKDIKENAKLRAKLIKSNNLLILDKDLEHISKQSITLKNHIIKINDQANQRIENIYQNRLVSVNMDLYDLRNVLNNLPEDANKAKVQINKIIKNKKALANKISTKIKNLPLKARAQRHQLAEASLSLSHNQLKALIDHKN